MGSIFDLISGHERAAKERKRVESKEPLTEQERLKRAKQVIAQRKMQAQNLSVMYAASFFFRQVEIANGIIVNEAELGDSVLGFPYEIYPRVEKPIRGISSNYSIAMYTERVSLTDDLEITHEYVWGDRQYAGRYSSYSKKSWQQVSVCYNNSTVLEVVKTQHLNNYGSDPYPSWSFDNEFIYKPGEWELIIQQAISPGEIANEKRTLEERKEAAKREMERRKAAQALRELEEKYGVSISPEGKVLYSKEEIDLERYRTDLIDKMEKRETIQ